MPRSLLACLLMLFSLMVVMTLGEARPALAADGPQAPVIPTIKGDFWTIATQPDLGEFTTKEQEPVDFGVWQAADGTWQLWSCVRKTKLPRGTRLFHRWEGKQLTDTNWKPMGVVMQADEKYGETPGSIQAPFVFQNDGKYIMFYGDWVNICSAESKDGKEFTRRLNSEGKAGLFSDGPAEINTRDPMVLKSGDSYRCYYTAHPGDKKSGYHGKDYSRTSKDLIHWSEPTLVASGGAAGNNLGSAECPFVVEPRPGHFYLFRTQRYFDRPLTRVYYSPDPDKFGVDEDAEYLLCELPVAAPEIIHVGDEYYIACLLPKLNGIRLARLDWVERK